jgi:excisionase family DNA binding protein
MTHHLQFNLDRLVTIPQLAKKLTVSVCTIRDWISRRKIPFTRFQRRITGKQNLAASDQLAFRRKGNPFFTDFQSIGTQTSSPD